MKGLLYKDAQLILNKVKIINRIFIALALFLITIFARESGTIFFTNSVTNKFSFSSHNFSCIR